MGRSSNTPMFSIQSSREKYSKMDEEGTPDVTSRTITALESAIKILSP